MGKKDKNGPYIKMPSPYAQVSETETSQQIYSSLSSSNYDLNNEKLKNKQIEIDIKNENKYISIEKAKIEFNDQPKYNDVWASILFFVVVILTVIVTCLAIPNMNLQLLFEKIKNSNLDIKISKLRLSNITKREIEDTNIKDIFIIFGTGTTVAIIITFIYFELIKRNANKMISGTLVISIVINFVVALFYTFVQPIVGSLVLMVAILYSVMWFLWNSGIPFATATIKSVISVIKQFPSTIWVGVVGSIVGGLWYIFIGFTLLASASYWGIDEERKAISYIIYVFLIFSFYYSSQVINNVVHVTVSGLFASYYLLGVNKPGTTKVELNIKNPTIKSLKRAITTSFGSICFGSLTISIIQTLRQIISIFKYIAKTDDDTFMCIGTCCLECLLKFVIDLISYFNIYAFTEVAIYGKAYIQAAKDTWTLSKDHGVDALLNDELIGNVLLAGRLSVGFISSLATCSIAYFVIEVTSGVTLIIYSLITILIGSMIFSTIGQVINSGVVTTFLCICEDPDALSRTNPEFWKKVRDAYPSVV